jgi:hypothetical protein
MLRKSKAAKKWDKSELKVIREYESSDKSYRTLHKEMVAAGSSRTFDAVKAKGYSMGLEKPNEYTLGYGPGVGYGPEITLFDIETSLIPAYIFDTGKQYVGYKAFEGAHRFMLSWSAKKLMSPDCEVQVLTPEEALAGDDSRIAQSLWDLFDRSDILVGHNSKRFDVPTANARFLENNFPGPPSSYDQIDTYVEAKRHFKLLSYSQDYITKMLHLPNKLATDHTLWRKCMEGDPEALKRMAKYNQGDIYGLEEVYLKFRPWMKSHPNVALYYSGDNVTRCHACGNTHLDWEDGGDYYTRAGFFDGYRCENCYTIGRSRRTSLTKIERESLVLPTAR